MNDYITVSRRIMVDLINAKAARNDLIAVMDEYAVQLKRIGALDAMANALENPKYRITENGRIIERGCE